MFNRTELQAQQRRLIAMGSYAKLSLLKAKLVNPKLKQRLPKLAHEKGKQS